MKGLDKRIAAERLFIAACARLRMTFQSDPDFPGILDILGETLPFLDPDDGNMVSLIVTARDLIKAHKESAFRDRDNFLSRLRIETEKHYRMAMAVRYEKFSKISSLNSEAGI